MPGAWSASLPRQSDLYAVNGSYKRGGGTSNGGGGVYGSTTNRPSQIPRAAAAPARSGRRAQNMPSGGAAIPAEQLLWQQAEQALGYAPPAAEYAQPQQYLPQQSPPQPQPLASEEQLYYQQQTQQQLSARSQPPPTPHSGRSPLPISRTAVRALNAPLPAQREQLILLRGGDSHPSSLISLWRSNSYSDVDVIVEGQAFYAHRLVLASGSEYLSALVENSPPLAMQGRRRAAVVELPGVSADAFEVLLEWLYCGEVGLAPSLLPSVLDAAVRLELTSLQSAVARALEDNLSAETCLVAWEAAECQGLAALAEASKTVALREFDNLVHLDAFAALPPDRLRELWTHTSLHRPLYTPLSTLSLHYTHRSLTPSLLSSFA